MDQQASSERHAARKKKASELIAEAVAERAAARLERRKARQEAARQRRAEAVAEAKKKKLQFTAAKKHDRIPGVKVRVNTITGRKQLLGLSSRFRYEPLHVRTQIAYSLQHAEGGRPLCNVLLCFYNKDVLYKRGPLQKQQREAWDLDKRMVGSAAWAEEHTKLVESFLHLSLIHI